MSTAARKARKRAGERYQPKPLKTPTGRLPKVSYDIPLLPLGVLDFARSVWESRAFR